MLLDSLRCQLLTREAMLDSQVDWQQEALLALSLSAEPLGRSGWAQWLGALQVRQPGASGPRSRQVSSTDLRRACTAWLAAEVLVEVDEDCFAVDRRRVHGLLGDPAARPTLERFERLLGDGPQVQPHGPAYHEFCKQYPLHVARARVAMYLGREDRALRLVDELQAWSVRHEASFEHYDPLRDLLPVGVDGRALAEVPEALRLPVAERVLAECLRVAVAPDAHWLGFALQLRGAEAASVRLSAASLVVLGAGDMRLLADLPEEATAEGSQVRAMVALREGRWDDARRFTRVALDLSRGPSKRRKPFLEGPLAPLLIVVLATGDAECRAAAEQHLKRAERTRAHRDLHCAARFLLERRHPLRESVSPWGDSDWQLVLTMLLTIVFLGDPGDMARYRERIADAARSWSRSFVGGGLGWLVDQLEGIAKVVSESLSGEDGAGLLATLQSPQAAWEHSLLRLEALVADVDSEESAKSAPEAQERLVFLAHLSKRDEDDFGGPDEWDDDDDLLDDDLCGDVNEHSDDLPSLHLQPRLQKRRGQGWTKGRSVALKTLVEQADRLDYLTAADRRVVATIGSSRDWYGGRTYYFGTRTPVALAGHPRVFWQDAPDGPPVEVVTGTPDLRVVERKGGLCLTVDPPFGRDGVGLRLEPQGQLTVCSRTNAQRQAIELIGRLAPVPKAGRARLDAVLAKLSAHFTVHADTARASAEVRQVEPDPRPVVILKRAEQGLQVRVVVRPLGPCGPSLVPGQGLAVVTAELDGSPTQCRRVLDRERAALSSACEAVSELAPAVAATHPIDTWEACLEFLQRLSAQAEAVVIEWAGCEPLEVLGDLDTSQLRLNLSEDNRWLELSGELVVDEALVLGLSELLAAAGGRFVQLADGRYAGLSAGLRERLLALARAGQVGAPEDQTAGKGRDEPKSVRLPPLALGFVSPWLRELGDGALRLNRRAKQRLERIEAAYARHPQLPKTLDAELRAYQLEGFRFLARVCEFGGGAMLADDMGLGKTLMALALLCLRGDQGPALVVVPLSLKRNWLDEASRFAPTLRMLAIDGAAMDGLEDLGSFDVVMASYGVATQQIERLEQVRWSTVLFDEAQAVKNPTAQRTRAARRLLADARVALTGTPVENHLGDLYSLMTLLNPGLLGSSKHFEERYARPIQQGQDADASQALRTLIAPFVLRRRKRDVLKELPPRTEVVLEVEPGEAERAFTEAVRRDALARLKKAAQSGQAEQSGRARHSAVTVLAEITRLRRAACHPQLVDAEVGAQLGSAKLERLLELVQGLREEGHRALVFSQFVDFLRLAGERLQAAGIRYQYLDGSTSEAQRKRSVDAFQAGEGELFLISLRAGGFGLNLTAADYVIHLDPWWNPAVEAQASDRAHRIGQTRPVTIYKLVNTASIEQRVLALHARKRELAEELMQDAGQVTKLDAHALMALIEDDGANPFGGEAPPRRRPRAVSTAAPS